MAISSRLIAFVLASAASLPAIATPQSPANQTPTTEHTSDIAGTPTESHAVGSRSDEIPLPVAAVWRDGPSGDVLLEPGSGNPHYLGMSAGRHYPPATERVDRLLDNAGAVATSYNRPRHEVYATILFQKRMTPERIDDLASLGVRVIGFQPHYALRVALPPESIQAVASHPAVRWVGMPRPWQKVHTSLIEKMRYAAPTELLDVWVFVQEDDRGDETVSWPVGTLSEAGPNYMITRTDGEGRPVQWHSHGWQHKALVKLGVKIDRYEPLIRAFHAKVSPLLVPQLAELDFVPFLEFDVPYELHHDESAPLISADLTRGSYDGGTNKVAIAGVIDTGLLASHVGLDHASYVGWNYLTGTAWTDECDHGSHVTGTMMNLPPASQIGHTGIAPGLGWGVTGRVRNVKAVYINPTTRECSVLGSVFSLLFGNMRANYIDSRGNLSPRPHVINNSYGQSPQGSAWVGSEASSIAFDTEVFATDQMYVFAAGNSGPGASTIGSPAVAKNNFTVGSVVDYRDGTVGDPGNVWTGSSRGPCGDGRWKPNVVAPGRHITSTNANGSYGDKSGTSMAAPHVTGLAAQLVDHYSGFRYAPARLASYLMATSITKGGVRLTQPTDTHLDQYGAGLVNADIAHNQPTSPDRWTRKSWGYSQGGSGFRLGVFSVPAGATRLIVCMHYLEAPALPGASRALVNNLDLYIDEPPVDINNGNTGEWRAQRSSIDNTEIRILDNPASGSWAFKTYPQSFAPFHSVKVGVTVVVVMDDVTPNLSVQLTANDQTVQPNDVVDLRAKVSSSAYIASATYLDLSPAGATKVATSTNLLDGIVTDLSNNRQGGEDVLLGSVRAGLPRQADWKLRWPSEGVKTVQLTARSDNANPQTHAVAITVDGTAPSWPTHGLRSTSHALSTWSNSRNISFVWNAPSDPLAGVAGYAHGWSSNSRLTVGKSIAFGPTTSRTVAVTADYSQLYYGLLVSDKCGNWTGQVTVGPYRIDTVKPGLPVSLHSTSHTTNTWSNQARVDLGWTAARDSASGLDGYGEAWANSAIVVPGPSKDIEETVTTRRITLPTGDNWHYALRSVDNAGNWSTSSTKIGPFLIDLVPPPGVLNLNSSTHTPGNTWSNRTQLKVSWIAARDLDSGLAGFIVETSNSATTVPTRATNAGASVRSWTAILPTDSRPWYLHVRSVDVAGNRGGTAHIGPFYIDTSGPTGPTGLRSSTHSTTRWSASDSGQMSWTAAVDPGSRLLRYRWAMNQTATTTRLGTTGALSASATSYAFKIPRSAHGLSNYFHIQAEDRLGNLGVIQTYGPIRVDSVAPTGVRNLVSPTHTPSAWSSQTTVGATWRAATDLHSGLLAHYIEWNKVANPTSLTRAVRLPATTTTYSKQLSSSSTGWYVHVQAQDAVGNLGVITSQGPFLIDTNPPANVTLDINNNATSIATHQVTLTVAATDPGGLRRMRFKNDGGNWSPWQSFAATATWDLFAHGGSSGTGTRRVDVEVEDNAGNAGSGYDRVFYYRAYRWIEPGCAGALGVPAFTATGGGAFSGAPMSLALSNTNAVAGQLTVGFSDQAWIGFPLPLDLGVVGSPGCKVHCSLDIPVYSGPPPATLKVPVPNSAWLIGRKLYLQWFLVGDPSGKPIVTSRGLEAEVNRS